ncbi:MAG: hypothetical protein R2828_18775 [Saprospiraceae bacterium]
MRSFPLRRVFRTKPYLAATKQKFAFVSEIVQGESNADAISSIHRHIGPYNLIKQSGQNMRAELKKRRFEIGRPYLEIYGHWTDDETKLETELIIPLK